MLYHADMSESLILCYDTVSYDVHLEKSAMEFKKTKITKIKGPCKNVKQVYNFQLNYSHSYQYVKTAGKKNIEQREKAV